MKHLKKLLAVILAITILCIPTSIVFAQDEFGEPTQKEIADDIYCKETFYNEDNILECQEISNINAKIDNSDRLVSITECEYCISETYDKDNNVIDSHLMTNREYIRSQMPVLETREISRRGTLIDGDYAESLKKYLKISIALIENSYGSYQILSTATWSTNSILGGNDYPDADAADFLIYTWGGDGEMVSTVTSASGIYQNDKDMPISKTIYRPEQSVGWQFIEKKGGLGSCMRDVHIEFNLNKKTSQIKNNSTYICCTYWHTFDGYKISDFNFSIIDKYLVPLPKVQNEEKSWKIECAVQGVKY